MGQMRKYRCPSCRYAETDAGGRSCGMIAVIETILCRDCRRLYDAIAEETPDEALQEDGRVRGNLTGIRCPVSENHSFIRWRKPWPCPRCNTQMVASKLALNWD